MSGYDLELEKAVSSIKEQNAKTVCVQLPDGLKPKFEEVVDHIEKETDAEVLIWSESCWGSCDIPNLPTVDLIIQWGHAAPSELKPKVTREDE
jgi:diphthamide biosynthesis enzyme Dph1/Dph2-like protein